MHALTTEKSRDRHWRIPIQLKFAVLFIGLSGALGGIWRVADATSRDVAREVGEIRQHTYPWMVESLRLDGEVVSIDFALESAVTFPSADQIAKLKQQDQAISQRFAKIESFTPEEHRPVFARVKAKYQAHVQAAIGLVEHLVAAEEAGDEDDVDEDDAAKDEPTKAEPVQSAPKAAALAKKPTTQELLAAAALARTAFAQERRQLLDIAHQAMQEGLGRTDATVHAQADEIAAISGAAAIGALLLLAWTAFGVARPMRRLRDWSR